MSTFCTATFRYQVIDESGVEYRTKAGLSFDDLCADVEHMARLVDSPDAKKRGYMPETLIASLRHFDWAGGFTQWIGYFPGVINGYFRKITVMREPNKDGGLQ